MKIIEKASLENKKMKGYYWMSDETEPRILKDELFDTDLLKEELPFVMEANFVCASENKSYKIQCLDLKYYIQEHELNPSNTRQTYYSTFFDKKYIYVEEVWQNIKDENCADLEIPIIINSFFVDFKDKD